MNPRVQRQSTRTTGQLNSKRPGIRFWPKTNIKGIKVFKEFKTFPKPKKIFREPERFLWSDHLPGTDALMPEKPGNTALFQRSVLSRDINTTVSTSFSVSNNLGSPFISQLTGSRKSMSLILQTCNRNNIHSILTFIRKWSHSA